MKGNKEPLLSEYKDTTIQGGGGNDNYSDYSQPQLYQRSPEKSTNSQRSKVPSLKASARQQVISPISSARAMDEGECKFLKDYAQCEQIQSLNAEIKSYQEKNQKPIDIYYENCNQYAKTYMRTNQTEIPEYKITRRDISNNVITRKLFDLKQCGYDELSKMSDKDISQMFDTETIKVFTDIIYIDNKHNIIVKVWQKIRFNCKLPDVVKANSLKNQIQRRKTQNYEGISKQGSSQQARFTSGKSVIQGMTDSVQQQHNHIEFYIKTIQFFDELGEKKNDPIVVEQVFGQFDESRLYDTSYLHYKDKVYYFKRLFIEEDEPIGKKDSQVQGFDQSIYSDLQLYSYDIRYDVEQEVEKYQIIEKDEDVGDDSYSDNQGSQPFSNIISQSGEKTSIQFNVQFSKEFGNCSSASKVYQDEDDFLKSQYFVFQRYIRGKESQTFNILSLKDFSYDEGESQVSSPNEMDIDTNSEEIRMLYKDDNNVNRQLQEINHFKIYSDPDPKDKDSERTVTMLVFIIQNMVASLEIQYDVTEKKVTKLSVFPRNQTDLFQKIWNNNGGVQVQRLCIERLIDTETEEKEKFEQYFFVDSRNRVQILYPNYNQKVERTKIIEMIIAQSNMKVTNPQEYKKITYIDQRSQEHETQRNVVQSIQGLLDILNLSEMTQTHQLTYVKDSVQQVLYIQHPQSNIIGRRTMKEHECELCFDNQGNNLQNYSNEPSFFQQKSQLSDEGGDDKLTEKQIKKALANYEFANKKQKGTATLENTNLTKARLKQWAKWTPNKTSQSDAVSDAKMNKVFEDDPQNFNEHELPYLSYVLQVQSQPGFYQDEAKLVKLNDTQKKNFVFIDDFRGNKVMVRTHTPNQSTINQIVRLMFYQCCGKTAVFIFAICNYMVLSKKQDSNNQDMNEDKVSRKSYIFIRKTKAEMDIILQSNEDVLRTNDSVYILKSFDQFDKINYKDIKDYQFGKNQLVEIEDGLNNDDRSDDHYKVLKLTFCREPHEKTWINFVPLLYQEQNNISNNKFMIYDILKNKFEYIDSNNPAPNRRNYLYEDDQMFNVFVLCRTSDIFTDKSPNGGEVRQRTKYQIYSFYTEKLGRFEVKEVLISHTPSKINVQTLGMKNILLSKKIIQLFDWENIKNTYAVPFVDLEGIIKGCQLLLYLTKENQVTINMHEQNMNNLHKYQSDVIVTGAKKFQIHRKDLEQFVIIVSTALRKKFIENNTFDSSEVYKVLYQIELIMLGMRTPDLAFITLNDFSDIKKNDFFRHQELLQGKSVMEICLSNPDTIKEAISRYDPKNDNLEGSIINMVCRDDEVRTETCKEIGLYPKQRLLQLDLNFRGTIERSLEQNAYKSLKQLLSHFFENVNELDYYPFLMNDLPLILDQTQLQVNDFFQNDPNERKNSELGCNIEKGFTNKNLELPMFSDSIEEFFTINEFESFHNQEQEIASQLISNDQQKGKIERIHETEHSYIDFSYTIVGEKVKKIDEIKQKKLKFDDIYYSKFMIKPDKKNFEFYLCESVQKIIDFQWASTMKIMKTQFFIYFFFYVGPIWITLFSKTEKLHEQMLKIAVVPAALMFFIECIQMKFLGPKNYFTGFNIIDFSQFFVFIALQYITYGSKDDSGLCVPELKLLLIILAFIKLLFYIRIFERYGFLVQMIQYCVIALFPFIMSYISFVIVFSICFAVLEMEIDPEVDEGAEGLNFFQKMILQTFRTAIGELGTPQYGKILTQNEKDPSFFYIVQIALMWLVWLMQSFFMLVIMTNFIVAVVVGTYDDVKSQQKMISYRQKAEMNVECYMLKDFFLKLKEYKIIGISMKAKSLIQQNNPVLLVVTNLNKFMIKETREIRISHKELNDNINVVKDKQNVIYGQLKKKFQVIIQQQQLIQKELFQNADQLVNKNK